VFGGGRNELLHFMDFNQFQALRLPMISLGGDQKELSQNRAEA
jgi:hypothetical protein